MRPVVVIACLAVGGWLRAGEPADLEKLVAGVAGYKDGQSRAALVQLTRVVAEASRDAERAQPLAKRLAALLGDPKVSREAKDFACRQLYLIATPEQLPVLAKLLGDEELSHMARYVLQPMADPAVDEVLRDALATVKGKCLVGVVSTIGERRDAKAIKPLSRLLGDADEAVALAAATALGKLGEPRAARAIAAARGRATGQARGALTQACLQSGDSLLRAGKEAEARAVFEALLAPAEPVPVRVAALRGRVAALSVADGVKLLMGIIAGDDAAMRAAAVGFLAGLRGPEATRVLGVLLPKSPPTVQQAILHELAARGERAAVPSVVGLARDSQDEGVRLAAVRALARLGSAAFVGDLASLAATERGALRDAARESLVALRGEGVDRAILAAAKVGDEATRLELIRSLGVRRAAALVPQIAQAAVADPSAAVRGQCLAVLADLAGGDELPRLAELLVKERDDAARTAAERAVVAVARRVEDPSTRLEPILAAHRESRGVARTALVRVLARLGGADALAAVQADLGHNEEAVREAALRALADWPDDTALPALAEIVKAPGEPTRRILALRGYIRLVGAARELSPEQAVGLYEFALRAASRPEEKKLALAGLAGVSHPAALKLAQGFVAEPALKAEAEQAVARIKAALDKPVATASHNQEAAHLALDGDKETRWKSLVNQSRDAGIWFQLDLRAERTLRRIVLVGNRLKPADYPRELQVYVASDPADWGEPVAAAKGTSTTVEIKLPPTRGRYLKLASVGSAGHNWSIYELELDAE